MESIIRSLYYGKVYPAEQIKPCGERYNSFNEQIAAHQEYFKKNLSNEDAVRLGEMENAYIGALDIEVFAGFSHGLKLGMMLALELMSQGEAG